MSGHGNSLSHLDSDGRARMVDVGDKSITARTATATGRFVTTPEVIGAVANARGTFPSIVSEESQWAEGKAEDNVAAVTAMAHNGEALITTSTWNEVGSKFAQYATDGFHGNRTAEEILSEIQDAVG